MGVYTEEERERELEERKKGRKGKRLHYSGEEKHVVR
jgi:hypothetical protein